ncbi:MAG TPA: gamma-glutamyltransferase family protein [Candidatus Dormibacteraeota bacterium]|nr:gamma-glutamyltransferase family protein [Candidatus Dormibacteraeota bacterium]
MEFTTRPELKGTFGMVSSTHWLATQSGMAVLERGGNAFDAAVAAGFVLQVVEPHLNGLGGDLPVVFWDATRSKAEVICGQGPAPAAASIDRIHEMGLNQIPGTGLVAACVPGAYGAWLTLLRDHGTWRLGDVLEFAAGYASGGYPLLPRIVDALAMVEPLFREHWPASAAVYLADGLPRPWQVFRNRDLAATYARLLREAESSGPGRERQIDASLRAFYSGFVADAVERHCRKAAMDSSGGAHAGLLTAADLARFAARHETPLTADFRGWTVAKCGPWSQGPVFLQQLRLLEGFDLETAGFLSAEHIHLVTECAKLAFADREAWYADPDFAEVPVRELVSREYAGRRRGLVGDRASFELRPGSPGGKAPRLPGREVQELHARHAAMPGDTVHVAVADRHGNLVACTPSGGWLQSSPVIDGLGFCLGTRAQMFNLDPQHPNRVEGGKRPRTTLSPTVAVHEDGRRIGFGTPGGDQQDQWTLAVLLRHLHHGLDLQTAIDMPLFTSRHFPQSFYPRRIEPNRLLVEERWGEPTITGLRRRGHDVQVEGPWALGRVCAVGRQDGMVIAAATPRLMQAYAIGR